MQIETDFEYVDIPEETGRYCVREIWSGEEWETSDGLEVQIGPRDVEMFQISP